jgi:hypothetical protein
MKSFKKAILFGILVWLIEFIVGFAAFPLRESNRPLFESIMPVTLSICTVLFSIIYFWHATRAFLRQGIMLGIVWLAISIIIDLPLFLLGGPMKMTLPEYLSDIGVTYLMIPVITTALAYAFGKQRNG